LSGYEGGERYAASSLFSGNCALTIGCIDVGYNNLITTHSLAAQQARREHSMEISVWDPRDFDDAFFIVSWLQSDLIDESEILSEVLVNYSFFASDPHYLNYSFSS
jgi:hypothetical protein